MIDAQQLDVIVINTVAVLTSLPEKKAEWREVLDGARQRADEVGAPDEHVFLKTLLAWLDGQAAPALAADNPYREAAEKIERMIRAGGVQAPPLPEVTLQALNKLLTSETWADARRVLEAHHEVLLQPLVEDALDQLAEGAINDGKPELAENFAMHRDLLRLCRERGVEEAFSDFGFEESAHLALVEMSVAGLTGGQAQRMALAQQIAKMLPSEEDPAERNLLETIQMAVFSKHPTAVRHNLQGEQAEVWEQIRARLAPDSQGS